MKEKTRLTRLIAILIQLQSKNLVTAKEIAARHDVSIRTVYRDIRALEQSGVPILTEEGRGYRIMPGYRLPPIMFSEEEANALITAESLVATNRDQSFVQHYENAMLKVKAVLQYTTKSKVDLLSNRLFFRHNLSQKRTSEYLMKLQAAITNFTAVKINYHSLQGEKSERVVEPFALYSTRDNWILIAFCRLRQAFRAFRLDCMQTLTILSTTFEAHPMSLQEYFEDCAKKFIPTPDIPLSPEPSIFVPSNQNTIKMIATTVESFHIIGIAQKMNHDNAMQEIPKLWNRFMGENLMNDIPNKLDFAIYALYTDYESDYKGAYTTILGCKVSHLAQIPEGMVGKSFKGGNYQKMTATGNLQDGIVYKAWTEIWKMDINRAYTTDFEIYGEPAQQPTAAAVDIYIAV
ncbi:MAG: WYL domain-containing protein [Bacteroidota bacterium]